MAKSLVRKPTLTFCPIWTILLVNPTSDSDFPFILISVNGLPTPIPFVLIVSYSLLPVSTLWYCCSPPFMPLILNWPSIDWGIIDWVISILSMNRGGKVELDGSGSALPLTCALSLKIGPLKLNESVGLWNNLTVSSSSINLNFFSAVVIKSVDTGEDTPNPLLTLLYTPCLTALSTNLGAEKTGSIFTSTASNRPLVVFLLMAI